MKQEIIKHAFNLIEKAIELDEVPVSAVIFEPETGKIIASAHNRTYIDNDASAHAEIVAIREAGKILQTSRLDGLAIYVTLEPCTMCAGAIAHSSLSWLYFGAYDEKGGAIENGIRFFEQPSAHHKISICGGIEQEKSSQILKDFFKSKRKNAKK